MAFFKGAFVLCSLCSVNVVQQWHIWSSRCLKPCTVQYRPLPVSCYCLWIRMIGIAVDQVTLWKKRGCQGLDYR